MKTRKHQKMPLVVPVLWFVTTGIWAIILLGTFLANVFWDSPLSLPLTILRGVVMVLSLLCAILNLIRYKKDKAQGETLNMQ